MCKSGLIKFIGVNEYEANSYFFGRGAWVDIYHRRQSGEFSLTITYQQNGEKKVKTHAESEK